MQRLGRSMVRSALTQALRPPLQYREPFNPRNLFRSGELGAVYDPSSFANVWQDTAATSAITALEQTVARADDKSGQGANALQATAGSRPTLTARVNLLTKSEQFNVAPWNLSTGDSVAANTITDPLGGTTADAYTYGTATNLFGYLSQVPASVDATKALTYSMWIKVPTGTASICLAISNQTVSTADSSLLPITATWQRFSFSIAAGALAAGIGAAVAFLGGLPGQVYSLWGAQLEYASAPTRYQTVDTASSYNSTGFAPYINYAAGTKNLVSTFASSLGAACTVAYAVPGVGTTILTAQTIGTTYTDTTNHAGKIIINRALTVAETSQVTAYLNSKAMI